MQVLVAPVEDDLQHGVELGQGRVASDQESTPDERADASQDDTQLIDIRVYSVLVHKQSVRRNPLCFKGSPQNLALSTEFHPEMHQVYRGLYPDQSCYREKNLPHTQRPWVAEK